MTVHLHEVETPSGIPKVVAHVIIYDHGRATTWAVQTEVGEGTEALRNFRLRASFSQTGDI